MSKQFKGIDVSVWQGDIDWKKVKASGIDFAILRLGYGSPNGDKCFVDKCFHKNVANAIKAGVDIGCYFYSYAMSVSAATKEAQFMVKTLEQYKGVFTYPIVFDLEDAKQRPLGKTTLTNMVLAFRKVIEGAGYWCTLYTNLDWSNNVLDDSKLQTLDHWIAQWSSKCTYKNKSIMGLWQYSDKGKVDGIKGNVDLDISYKDYPALIRGGNLNGFKKSSKPATVKPVEKPVEKPSSGNSPVTKSYYTGKFAKNTIVKFNGNSQFVSSNAKSGTTAKPCKVKITDINKSGKYPYHCRSVDDKGKFISGVYGWVSEKDLSVCTTKSIDEIAKEVIQGKWGNEPTRFKKLKEAGYDPEAIQKRVNEMLK